MDREVKRRWIEALRSGDYLKVEGRMRVDDDDGHKRMCVLGVLCDVVSPRAWVRTPSGDHLHEDGTLCFPTPEVLREAKLHPNTANALLSVNDGTDADFCALADEIEKL